MRPCFKIVALGGQSFEAAQSFDKSWFRLLINVAVTITKPHAVAWTVWFPWLPPSSHNQEEDQEEDGVGAAEIEGESPYLIEDELEANNSPSPDVSVCVCVWEESSSQ
jgi:hypothetical protein